MSRNKRNSLPEAQEKNPGELVQAGPGELAQPAETKTSELSGTDVSFGSQVEVKSERTVSKTDSGLYMVENKVTSKRPHFVKKIDSDSFAVVTELGETVRVYTKEKGCENPKAAAESFARKMSLRWL